MEGWMDGLLAQSRLIWKVCSKYLCYMQFVFYLSHLSRASSVTLPRLLWNEFIMQSAADVELFSYLCSSYFLYLTSWTTHS